jgi:hypothetical protein
MPRVAVTLVSRVAPLPVPLVPIPLPACFNQKRTHLAGHMVAVVKTVVNGDSVARRPW